MNFVDNSKEVKKEMDNRLFKALHEVGITWQAHAVRGYNSSGLQVITGTARGSLDYNVDTAKKNVYIGSNVHYFPYLELGTWFLGPFGRGREGTGIAPRNIIRNAVMDNTNEYKQIFSRGR